MLLSKSLQFQIDIKLNLSVRTRVQQVGGTITTEAGTRLKLQCDLLTNLTNRQRQPLSMRISSKAILMTVNSWDLMRISGNLMAMPKDNGGKIICQFGDKTYVAVRLNVLYMHCFFAKALIFAAFISLDGFSSII